MSAFHPQATVRSRPIGDNTKVRSLVSLQRERSDLAVALLERACLAECAATTSSFTAN